MGIFTAFISISVENLSGSDWSCRCSNPSIGHVYQSADIRSFCMFFFRSARSKSWPMMTISVRIMNLLPGWKKRKMCSSLSFHLSLHVNCSQTLSRLGTSKSLNPVTMRAFLVGPGHPITGKSKGRKKVRHWLIPTRFDLYYYFVYFGLWICNVLRKNTCIF